MKKIKRHCHVNYFSKTIPLIPNLFIEEHIEILSGFWLKNLPNYYVGNERQNLLT